MDTRTPAMHVPGLSRARLKRVIAVGNAAALAIGFWEILFPAQLYTGGLLLCALLPIGALALEIRTRGALGFEARRGRRYPLSIATILLLPAIALALRAGIDLNFVSYPALFAAAVLTASAMFALFWRYDLQLRGDLNQVATIAIFVVAYSYGAVASGDVMLDASSGRDAETVIHDKRVRVSGGPKGSSVWYQVKVDPDASPAGANWIHVQPDLWASVHRGDTVCVHVGAGLFAIPWYAVDHCAPI